MAKYRKIISIEIGLSTTKICEMDFKKKNPKIYKCVIFDTPENTVEDGYIRDRKTFASAVKEYMFGEKMKCKDVVFTISSNKVISREVIIPEVKDKLIRKVIGAEINDYFPMDISDHAISHTIVERKTEDKTLRLVVYAVPENMIKNYYNLAEELRFNIVSLDYVENSTLNWLKRCDIDPTSFVLQVNEQTTMLTVIKNNIMVFQRVIGYGINTIAEAVVMDSYYKESNIKEALQLMKETSVLKERTDENIISGSEEAAASHEQIEYPETNNQVMDATRILIGSISRVIEYYTSKNKQSLPEKIYLTGNGADVLGLFEILTAELGIVIEKFKPAERISFRKKAGYIKNRCNELISCLGASVDPVNFISKNMLLAEQKKSTKSSAILLVLLAVASAVALTMVPFNIYQEERTRNNKLKELLDSYPSMDDIYNEYNQMLSLEQEINEFHNSTFSYSEIFSELVGELENKLPSGSMLRSLTLNNSDFTMSIMVQDKEMAERFLMQLQLIPYIDKINISGLTEVLGNDMQGEEVNFSVTCTYKIPGADTELDDIPEEEQP